MEKLPVQSYGSDLTLEDGYCAQDKYLKLLKVRYGPAIGYKVGFTGKASQERFGVSKPVYGKLFGPMLLKSGSTLDLNFGVRPLFEPDLVVTVKDEGINDAQTMLEVAQHLS